MGGTFSSNPSTAWVVTESQENQGSPGATESQENQGSPVAAPGPDEKPKKKICCACPETKKLRDECIVTNGEAACSKLIEAHLTCLRAEGFNV